MRRRAKPTPCEWCRTWCVVVSRGRRARRHVRGARAHGRAHDENGRRKPHRLPEGRTTSRRKKSPPARHTVPLRHPPPPAPDGVERLRVGVHRRELLRGVADGPPVVRLAPPDQLDEALPVEAVCVSTATHGGAAVTSLSRRARRRHREFFPVGRRRGETGRRRQRRQRRRGGIACKRLCRQRQIDRREEAVWLSRIALRRKTTPPYAAPLNPCTMPPTTSSGRGRAA